MAHASFDTSQSNVSALDAALRGFITSLQGFHLSAQVLYGAVEAIGAGPDSSVEMKHTVAALKDAFVHVDVHALQDSIRRFDSRVLRPTSGWVGRAATLKHQVAEFQEEKLVYDHYTRKVLSLREARDKRASSGKMEKPKDVEKLVRNEQKLAATTNAYARSSESTVANLREFVNTREATLAPILQRVLEFRVQYAGRIADESKLLHQLIRHDPSHDTVLATLEAMAAQFTGVNTPAAADQEQVDSRYAPVAAVEPELPIQSLSFESFVGETATNARTASRGEHGQSQMFGTTASAPPPTTDFFDDFVPPPPPPPSAFQTAPVHPYPVATVASPTGVASFSPWDAIPPPPPMAKPVAVASHNSTFATMPTSPVAHPPPASGWDAFGGLGADPAASFPFATMHQQGMQ
jgi:hypothetical protein